MTNRQTAVAAIAAILVSLAPVPGIQKDASAQSAAAAPVLKIGGKVATPLELSAADLKKLPRKTLSVTNPHDKKTEVYDGVLLQDLFHRAGVPQGHDVRGPVMATYVLAEASDGYRAVFSLAELDSEFADSDVIVADCGYHGWSPARSESRPLQASGSSRQAPRAVGSHAEVFDRRTSREVNQQNQSPQIRVP